MLLILYLAVLAAALYWVSRTLWHEMHKSSLDLPQAQGPDERIERLEALLAEKNESIHLLQAELKIFHAQERAFDQVKALLSEEIHRLKEQNRIFRSELGLPAAFPKENSVT